MRLEIIEGIRLLIVATLVYIPTVTISGWFTAWVAKQCGDDLPERFGFLTLDPFSHISLFGFGLLLIGKFFGNVLTIFKDIPGFGRFILLEPAPHTSKMAVVVEFLARSIAHFLMMVASFVCIILLFKGSLLHSSSLLLSQTTSLFEAFREIMYFFFAQNKILFVIYCLIGISDMICHFLQVPRFFSPMYFCIVIAVFLLGGSLVEDLSNLVLIVLERLLTSM